MLKMRCITQEDNDAVKSLINSIMSEEFVDSAPAYAADDLEDACGHYGGKNEVFIIAENAHGHIVGTVGIKNDSAHTALLRRFFLKKDFRGKGYGKKLLTQALDFCKEHGYKKILFRGADAMSAAYKTCIKNGFREKDILVLPHAKMFVLEHSI